MIGHNVSIEYCDDSDDKSLNIEVAVRLVYYMSDFGCEYDIKEVELVDTTTYRGGDVAKLTNDELNNLLKQQPDVSVSGDPDRGSGDYIKDNIDEIINNIIPHITSEISS